MAMLNQILNQSERPYEQYHKWTRGWNAGLMSIENLVAARIHEEFETLPTRCKPRRFGANNEFTEWTIVAGIALVGRKLLLSTGPEGLLD